MFDKIRAIFDENVEVLKKLGLSSSYEVGVNRDDVTVFIYKGRHTERVTLDLVRLSDRIGGLESAVREELRCLYMNGCAHRFDLLMEGRSL